MTLGCRSRARLTSMGGSEEQRRGQSRGPERRPVAAVIPPQIDDSRALQTEPNRTGSMTIVPVVPVAHCAHPGALRPSGAWPRWAPERISTP